MELWKKSRREFIFLCVRVILVIFAKNVTGLAVSLFFYIGSLHLCLWYLREDFSLKTDFSSVPQILHGLWSGVLMLVINVAMAYVCFGIHITFVFHVPARSSLLFNILFWALVAVTEELNFRVCFYRIFEKMHMHKLWNAITVSLVFGVGHLYVDGMPVQCISTIIFSLLLFCFLHAVDHYTIVSCTSAHFIYGILCIFLVYS